MIHAALPMDSTAASPNPATTPIASRGCSPLARSHSRVSSSRRSRSRNDMTRESLQQVSQCREQDRRVVPGWQPLHTEAVALMLGRLDFVVATPLLVAGALFAPQLVTATHSVATGTSARHRPPACTSSTFRAATPSAGRRRMTLTITAQSRSISQSITQLPDYPVTRSRYDCRVPNEERHRCDTRRGCWSSARPVC